MKFDLSLGSLVGTLESIGTLGNCRSFALTQQSTDAATPVRSQPKLIGMIDGVAKELHIMIFAPQVCQYNLMCHGHNMVKRFAG